MTLQFEFRWLGTYLLKFKKTHKIKSYFMFDNVYILNNSYKTDLVLYWNSIF